MTAPLRFLALSFALSFSIAACGDDDSDAPTGTGSDSTPPTSGAPPTSGTPPNSGTPPAGTTSPAVSIRSRLGTCPTAIESNDPEIYRCLIGEYAGVEKSTGTSCIARINDDGSINLKHESTDERITLPYVSSNFSKIIYLTEESEPIERFTLKWSVEGPRAGQADSGRFELGFDLRGADELVWVYPSAVSSGNGVVTAINCHVTVP